MRIALISHACRAAGGLTGTSNFINCLRTVAPQHQYLLIAAGGVGFENVELPAGSEKFFCEKVENKANRLILENFHLPKLVKKFGADWVIGLGNSALINPPCRQAIWIRDAHLVYPWRIHNPRMDLMERLVRSYQVIQLRLSLAKTDVIFCQTPVMKKRFSDKYKFPLDSIKILPNAVSGFLDQPAGLSEEPIFKKKPGQFVLFFLAQYYSHKNLEILIPLFKKYAKELENVICVITIETKFSMARKFLEAIRTNNLSDKIINTGSLRQAQLAAYYDIADVVFLPTLLESFSATYLEAMHFRKPLLTSDFDFSRYICGDAAVYFNPFDINDIANKIVMVKNNPEFRNELAAKGAGRVVNCFAGWDELVREAVSAMENWEQNPAARKN